MSLNMRRSPLLCTPPPPPLQLCPTLAPENKRGFCQRDRGGRHLLLVPATRAEFTRQFQQCCETLQRQLSHARGQPIIHSSSICSHLLSSKRYFTQTRTRRQPDAFVLKETQRVAGHRRGNPAPGGEDKAAISAVSLLKDDHTG